MDFEKLKLRVIGMLRDPTFEWRMIVGEPADIASLYQNYIVPLAAIPAVATFIGLAVVGLPFTGRAGFFTSLSSAVIVFVQTLAAPMIAAVAIEQLAPKFKSSGSRVDALKLVAYASTPVWVGSVVFALPYIAIILTLAVAYAAYLFYIGLTPIMKTPADSVVPFLVVSALTLLVVNLVLRLLLRVFGLPSIGF